MISYDKRLSSRELSSNLSDDLNLKPFIKPDQREGGVSFPKLVMTLRGGNPFDCAFFTFLILSLCLFPAFSQKPQEFKSFDVVRDIKKPAVDFLSCFSTANFPVTVTTEVSPIFTVGGTSVDSGGSNA